MLPSRPVRHHSQLASDGELLESWVGEQDDDALLQLIQRYAPLVHSTCCRRLGAGSDHDADDAAQATFIALSRHASAIRNPASLPLWLHRTALRACSRLIRSAKRRHHHEQTAAAIVSDDEADLDDGWSQARLLLDSALESIPAQDRGILIAYIVDGQSQGDLAQRTGVSREALKKRIQRCLSRLEAWYRGRGINIGAPALLLGVGHDLVRSTPAVASCQHAVLHPGVLSAKVSLLVAHLTQWSFLSKCVAIAVTVSIITGLGGAIVRNPWVESLVHEKTPGDVHHAVFLNFISLAILIPTVGAEEAICWWRTREGHWAPLFLLGLNTSLTALFFLLWITSLSFRLHEVEYVVIGSLRFSLFSFLLAIVVPGYLLAGLSWAMERQRNRRPIPSYSAWLRSILLLAMMLQAWVGFMSWIIGSD